MAKRLYECVVCGRKFPEGQGIVISKGSTILYFHSSRCAAKFLRALLENSENTCIEKSLSETLEQFLKAIERKRKSSRKVI